MEFATARGRALLASCATLAFVAIASPAHAQRTRENAVTSASDAFGSSVGNERVGLYNPGQARGFNPLQAGNARMEGLYIDVQADASDRLVGGSTMRVGLTAQGYPFPAPSGIADFSLRKVGSEYALSTSVGYGPFGGTRLEFDAQLPFSKTLGVAAGASINREGLFYGANRSVFTSAIIPRWRPSENVELLPYLAVNRYQGHETFPIIYTGGAYLPPTIERRKFFGQPWAENKGWGINYGIVSKAQMGKWTLRSGLFRSLHDNQTNFTELQLNTSRDGMTDRFLVADADRAYGSISGEMRLSRQIQDGDRRHQIHLSARGRKQSRRYGGGQTISLGRSRIDEVIAFDKPKFNFGPQTRDRIEQFTMGLGYDGIWLDRGEITLGLQKTFYKKDVRTPKGDLPQSKDSPLLPNAALSLHANSKLVLYAGYTKGLEESPIAPDVALNKGEAPPAIITEQMDAGFRYTITKNLRLVAGVFDVRKPHYGLDSTRLYRNLGEVRHRGVELSLAGTLARGLNLVFGTVLLDAELRGDAVEQGLVGKRPIASGKRTTTANLDYQLPWVKGASLDLSLENLSPRIADRLNSFTIPSRTVVSVGGRYRLDVAGKPTMIRAQVGNLFNENGWVNVGPGFYYLGSRRFSLSLTTDL